MFVYFNVDLYYKSASISTFTPKPELRYFLSDIFSILLKGADVSQTNLVNLIEDKKASSNFNKQRKSMTWQTWHCLLVTLYIQVHTHSSLRSSSVNIINNVYIGLLHRIPSQTFELLTSERWVGWKTTRVFATLRLFI